MLKAYLVFIIIGLLYNIHVSYYIERYPTHYLNIPLIIRDTEHWDCVVVCSTIDKRTHRHTDTHPHTSMWVIGVSGGE